MRARLLILGCFTHDSQRVLTAVRELALVHAEPLLNIVLGRFDRHQTAGELRVAILTDAEQGMVTHEFKFSLCHVSSLRRSFRRSSPVEIKRHHYRKCAEAVSQPLTWRLLRERSFTWMWTQKSQRPHSFRKMLRREL
jgi:hypothetical protein